MIPIFEQGKSQGIGHSFDSFLNRFRQICKSHIDNKRAHAFAFIFYDFTDNVIREILKSQGGFARLDRLSGNKLSVFYLHSNSRRLNKHFNETFRYVFEIDEEINLPFVLFLKFNGEIDEIEDLRITQLEHDNPLFAFNELYESLEEYIKQIDRESIELSPKKTKVLKLVDKYTKMAFDEFVKLVLKEGYEMLR